MNSRESRQLIIGRNKMKDDKNLCVLFIHKFYLPSHGGIEWLMHSIARGLVLNKIKVRVITTFFSSSMHVRDIIDNVLVYRVPANYLYLKDSRNPIDIIINPSSSLLIDSLVKSSDIIHLFASTPSHLLFETINIARKNNKPIIWQPIFIPNRLSFHKSLIRRTLFKTFDKYIIPLLAKKVDLIIALTEAEASYFRKYGVPAIVMGECVPQITIDKQTINSVLNKYGLEPNSYVLYVGRLDWYKGYDILLPVWRKIVSKYNNLKLVIVGSDWGYKKTILNYIKSKSLENNVIILSNIDEIELHSLYEGALFVALLTRWETFHRIALEAWSHHKPIVALDIGEACDHIRLGGGILIKESKLHEVVLAFKELIENEEFRLSLGMRGFSIYKSKYSIETYAKKLNTIYSKLIETKRSSKTVYDN